MLSFEEKNYNNRMIKRLNYPRDLSELKNKNVLLSYTGGLDSTTCLKYLIENNIQTFPVLTPKPGLAGKAESILAKKNYTLIRKQSLKKDYLRDLFVLNFSRPYFPHSYSNFSKRKLQKKHFWIDYFMLTKSWLNFVDLCYDIESTTNEKIRTIIVNFIDDDTYHNPGETLTICLRLTNLIRAITKDDSWLILPPFLGFISKKRFSKKDILDLALKLDVDLKNTFSCKTKFLHCGQCDGCKQRIKAFADSSHVDKTIYLNHSHIYEIIGEMLFMLKLTLSFKIHPTKNIRYYNNYKL